MRDRSADDRPDRDGPDRGEPTRARPNRGRQAPPANEWVGDWSARRARLSPDAVGLVDDTAGVSFTYDELDRRANRTARLLAGVGASEGGAVATVSRNRPELVDLFFGTGKVGGVLAPLSHRLAPPELAALLDTVDPAALVVEVGQVDLVADALAPEDCGASPTVLVLGEGVVGADDGTSASPDPAAAVDDGFDEGLSVEAYADRLPAGADPVDRPDVSLSDTHLLLHTGGSTGLPKETEITHEAVYWNSFNTITAWGLRPDDATPMTFPMFHTGGWNVITVPLFHLGGTVVVAREFDPGQVLRAVEAHDATLLVAVPAVLRMMANHDAWADTDLSTLRFAKSGGGPCRQAVLETWWDRGVDLSQGYGLTECGPNNFAMPTDWPRGKADSVGVPAMHVDARVVDDDGRELPQGEVGELELSGPHAAAGYLDNDAETAATFGARDGESSGWVSTGDLARVDEDGYYHVEGRKKNMFVSGGENVYPPEVEDVVADHPRVEDVVVVGVPDDKWGTVGKAVVVGDDSLTLEELRSFCEDRLARFKHPRDLDVVDEFPMSGPSKIDRDAVAERYGGVD